MNKVEVSNNVIYNEDCMDIIRQLPDNSVDLIVTDPPYLISRDSNFSKGKVKNTDVDRFRISIDFGDWDSEDYFTLDNFETVVQECYRVLKRGGTLITFFDLWKLSTARQIFEKSKFKQIRFAEWVKTNPVPINSKVNYLTNCREILISGVKGSNPTFNSQYDNGIYLYPICHGKERTSHPTQKPLSLIEDIIKKHSNEGDVVLDCFMGSGTTGVACINLGRVFIGIERDKDFFNISKERLIQSELSIDNKLW